MELENIYMLSVGQLRELLAYACAEESVDSWWEDITEDDLERVGFYDDEDDYDYDDDTAYDERVGFYDELDDDDDYDGDSSYYDDNYDEDTDYDEDDELWDDEDEDEDYYDEDEEDDLDLGEDEVCIGGALPIPEEEELAQSIAVDIRNGRYALHTLNGVYSVEILNRISELI